MRTKLKASVIGGGLGGQLSLGGLHLSNDYDLTAVVDLRPEVCQKLKETYPGIQTFSSYPELFKQCPTDVVCVSTYAPSHEEITLAALQMPTLKGLLVEKPVGCDAASGRRIREAIQAKKIPTVVPHGLLTRKTPLEIIERVQNGEIGDLQLVEVQCNKWDLFNAGIHWFNFFVNLTRLEPIDFLLAICDSSTRTYRDGMQVETTAVTYVQTKSGVRLVMNTGDFVLVNAANKNVVFHLIGSKGKIEFYGWENGYFLQNSSHPAGDYIVPTEFPNAGHQRHLENLAQQIATQKTDYRVLESSLMASELCDGAYLSSKHRCKVTFPLHQFSPPPAVDWNPGQPYSGTGGGRDGRTL